MEEAGKSFSVFLFGEQSVLWGELSRTLNITLLSEMKRTIILTMVISALLISLLTGATVVKTARVETKTIFSA
jgi:hypothetical protein